MAQREIEIIPKRDRMGEKRTAIRKSKPHVTRGSQLLAAKSVPLDPVMLAILPRTPASLRRPMSKPVNLLVKPERRRHEGAPSNGAVETLRSALAAIPNDDGLD